MKIIVDISINDDRWEKLPTSDYTAIIRHIHNIVAPDLNAPVAEYSLLLTCDSEIRTLNASYRGKDAPTNVLSFPCYDGEAYGAAMMGDIVMSLDTILREAEEAGVPPEHHITHMVVHGTLHLLGYDHEEDEEAEEMEGLEGEILSHFNIPNPYA